MEEQTENAPQLLQGAELANDRAAKQQQAQASADRVLALLQAEHDALEGISPTLRADLMFMKAYLEHSKTKI